MLVLFVSLGLRAVLTLICFSLSNICVEFCSFSGSNWILVLIFPLHRHNHHQCCLYLLFDIKFGFYLLRKQQNKLKTENTLIIGFSSKQKINVYRQKSSQILFLLWKQITFLHKTQHSIHSRCILNKNLYNFTQRNVKVCSALEFSMRKWMDF